MMGVYRHLYSMVSGRVFSTTQLASATHTFASILSLGILTLSFFYFKKALDLVSYNKVIFKLRGTSLPNFIVNWVSAYLSNCTQLVDLNGRCLSEVPITSGIPLGSISGCLLFLIHFISFSP